MDTKFIFCPRCGAIMEPPVCRVCGYDMNAPEYPEEGYSQEGYSEGQGGTADGQQFAADGQEVVTPNYTPVTPNYNQGAPYMQQGPGQQPQQRPNGYFPNPDKQSGPKFTPAEKKKKKWWIPLIIGGAVMLVLLFICIGVMPTVAVLFPQIIKAKNKKQQASQLPSNLYSGSQLASEVEENEELVKRHLFSNASTKVAALNLSGCGN